MRRGGARDQALAAHLMQLACKAEDQKACQELANVFPEKAIEEAFIGGCSTKSDPALCRCVYTELLKVVSAADISTQRVLFPDKWKATHDKAIATCTKASAE
jgi:hypothetical protein